MVSTKIPTQLFDNGSDINSTEKDINLPTTTNIIGDNSTVSMGKFFESNKILYVHSAVLITVNLLSICSNLTVILLYAIHRRLRTKPNVIVMSFTSSDLLFAVLMFSFSAMTKTTRRGDATVSCVLVNFALIYLSVTVSGWSLVALAIERYLSIHRPFQSRRNISMSSYLITVTGIWCFGLLITGMMVAPWHGTNVTSTAVCGGLIQYTTFTTSLTVMVQAVLPITIIAVLYALIARTAKIHRRAINSLEMQVLTNYSPSNSPQPSPRSRQKSWFRYTVKVAKGTKVLLFACLSLIITWSPIFIVLQLFVFCSNCHRETMYYLFLFGTILFQSKGFIHPLAYTLRDKEFKRAASKTLTTIRTKCSGTKVEL